MPRATRSYPPVDSASGQSRPCGRPGCWLAGNPAQAPHVGFVVLAALFTIGCDKLIGPDEAAMADEKRDEMEAARRESLT